MSLSAILVLSDFLLLSFPLFGATLVSIGNKDFGLYSMSDVENNETITKSYDQIDPTQYVSNFYLIRIIFLTGYALLILTEIIKNFYPSYRFTYLLAIITGITNLVSVVSLISLTKNSNEQITYSGWVYVQIIMSLLIIASGLAVKFNLIKE